jgi:hypothetical protein
MKNTFTITEHIAKMSIFKNYKENTHVLSYCQELQKCLDTHEELLPVTDYQRKVTLSEYEVMVMTYQVVSKLKAINQNVEECLKLYTMSVSLFQGNQSKSGKIYESFIETMLLQNEIPYKAQVKIDNDGKIITTKKKNSAKVVVDFVIGNHIAHGKDIEEYIVLSTKRSCRERWTQDSWIENYSPRAYFLVTDSADYPSSTRFGESEKRKIVTSKEKRRDDRMYKYDYEDLIQELKKCI